MTSTPGADGASSEGRIGASPPVTASSPATLRSVRSAPDAFAIETVTVEVQGNVGRNVFTPGYPTVAFAPLIVHEPRWPAAAWRTAVRRGPRGGQGIPDHGGDLDRHRGSAGRCRHGLPGRNRGDLSRHRRRHRAHSASEAQRVVDAAGATDPYHMAGPWPTTCAPIPVHLPDGGHPASGPNRDIVDFFLFDPNGQVGYCEYFATTMAVMARTLGLAGPGGRRLRAGRADRGRASTRYREKNAHAWAEVFFPGYGWQIFEATKSDRPRRPRRRLGDRAAARPPRRPAGPRKSASPRSEDLRASSTASNHSTPVRGGSSRRGARRDVDASQRVALAGAASAAPGGRRVEACCEAGIGSASWRRATGSGSGSPSPADRAGRRAAPVGDGLRIRRLAGGADPAAARRDPPDRRRQGLAELLGPIHLVRGDRAPRAGLEPAAAAARCGSPCAAEFGRRPRATALGSADRRRGRPRRPLASARTAAAGSARGRARPASRP